MGWDYVSAHLERERAHNMVLIFGVQNKLQIELLFLCVDNNVSIYRCPKKMYAHKVNTPYYNVYTSFWDTLYLSHFRFFYD
jgi:hypothetical protein